MRRRTKSNIRFSEMPSWAKVCGMEGAKAVWTGAYVVMAKAFLFGIYRQLRAGSLPMFLGCIFLCTPLPAPASVLLRPAMGKCLQILALVVSALPCLASDAAERLFESAQKAAHAGDGFKAYL